MIIQTEQEVLRVALEMEKRAIRIYERALMIVEDEEVASGIRRILRDERGHLRRFMDMKNALEGKPEREKLLLQSVAAEILFPGGVMEMERANSLTSLKALYAYAAQSEEDAVAKYNDFAERCATPGVREAFLAVAREEAHHLSALRQRLL